MPDNDSTNPMTDKAYPLPCLHNDEPVLDDALERVRLAERIADAVATCDPPQVFGVHGDWGLGKTSLLHQIAYILTEECPPQTERVEAAEKDKNGKRRRAVEGITEDLVGKHKDHVKVIWFEAWRYQAEPVPIVALLQTIRSQLAWYLRVKESAGKCAEVAARSLLGLLGDMTAKIGLFSVKLGNPLKTIQEAGEQWEKENYAEPLPCDHIQKTLEGVLDGLLKNLLKKKGAQRRIVVIVDDLDRCESEAAYRLLEGLKIFLRLNNCVFLLGMNQQIVEDAIVKHIPDGETRKKQRAAAYLEKLCQTVWHLPAVRDRKKYLLHLLKEIPEGDRTRIGEALGDYDCLPPNPRRLKGIANAILRKYPELKKAFREMRDSDTADHLLEVEKLAETRRMLIVALIYQLHPDLHRVWELHPDLYERILKWAKENPFAPLITPPVEKHIIFKKQIDHIDEILNCLQRPFIYRQDNSIPIPGILKLYNAYPDPSDPCVMWAQPLLIEEEQHNVESREIEGYSSSDEKNVFFRYLCPGTGRNA